MKEEVFQTPDFLGQKTNSTEQAMALALALARQAASEGEVPVGCVITDEQGLVLGTGRNRREQDHDATAHAEIAAIRQACGTLGNWRLTDCRLYVTLEPCPMCAGAIINARVSRLYYGAKEAHSGSCGSIINLFMESYGHEPRIEGGILEEECAGLLRSFFEQKRK